MMASADRSTPGGPYMSTPPPLPGKSSTGLDANIAALLTYLLGFISGIIFLAIEKDSQFVRFHAMQSTIVSIGLFVLNIALGFIPVLGWLVGLLLAPIAFLLWIFLMFKAFQGERFKLPVVGDIAEQQVAK
jgi:uncharacterized membrane protein